MLRDLDDDFVLFGDLLFSHPIKIIHASSTDEIKSALQEIEQEATAHFVAGYLSYECGMALQNMVPKNTTKDFLRFGVFSRSSTFKESMDSFAENMDLPVELTLQEDIYKETIRTIKEHLERGESYQVNFTARYGAKTSANPIALYYRLRESQISPYTSLMHFGDEWILSFSPELFFRKKGNHITMQPMKGTAKRGRLLPEDHKFKEALYKSEKDRAENIMIVDLIRNDLGRICETKSIHVDDPFAIKTFLTVHQMISTVTGTLKADITFTDILQATFPSGSVTGAPKLRTMKIIESLEPTPRGVYCGAIGYLGPKNEACFNVAIRTLHLHPDSICHTEPAEVEKIDHQSKDNVVVLQAVSADRQAHHDIDQIYYNGVYGAGGGITILSDPQKEWEELQLKAQLLTHPIPPFQLIETMRCEEGTIELLDLHRKRLKESAEYFGFLFDRRKTDSAIDDAIQHCNADSAICGTVKLRLLLSRDGSVILEQKPIEQSLSSNDSKQERRIVERYIKPLRVCLSDKCIDSQDVFLYHKTTNRLFYNEELAKARSENYDDVLFTNERGELTEGCIHNLIVEMDGTLYTPPVVCGLLGGVYRQWMIDEGKLQELILTREDLRKAEKVYLCNAIRKQQIAEIL